ncbi:MAG: ABC transporter permease [Phycisphaerales bacterium]|nr:ABC transporter permease [Phycisphaerales bacterium]
MKKTLGIFGLLVVVCILTAVLSDRFLTAYNIQNVLRRSALFGIISIGVGFVIMARGIDLSIGSVICLVGCLFPWMLSQQHVHPAVAASTLLACSAAIGLVHGLIITKLRIQAFVVTLCGLLLYRGIARGVTDDQTQGFGTGYEMVRSLGAGSIHITEDFAIRAPVIYLLVIAALAWVFLNRTIWGRYILAIGRNENAARYSGINTDLVTIATYVICSTLAGFGGLLFIVDVGSAQPVDFGNFYELYAIAAAVLGGCSLRGGEGTVFGVIIGAAVMQVLRNAITLIDWIPNNVEFAVIGAVILAGVVSDELVKRVYRIRKTK